MLGVLIVREDDIAQSVTNVLGDTNPITRLLLSVGKVDIVVCKIDAFEEAAGKER